MAAAVGLILMTIGCVIFAIGQCVGDSETKAKAKKQFWVINVWTLSFIPVSMFISAAGRFFLYFYYRSSLVPFFRYGSPSRKSYRESDNLLLNVKIELMQI